MSVPSNKGLVVLGLGVAVVAAYLLAASMGLLPSSIPHGDRSLATGGEVLADDHHQASPRTASLIASCLPPTGLQTSPATLQQMLFRAREHAETQHYNEALAEFSNLANADPALPGLNLNMSMALMHLKRAEEAKAAIDTQLALSECLAKLPVDQFATYCRSEMPLQSTESCRGQTQDVRRTAHMQAALVEMELGRSLQTGSTTALDETTVAASAPAPPPGKLIHPTAAAPGKHPVDQSLAHGTGTDAELGAYSK